jgi:hypothetical protein
MPTTELLQELYSAASMIMDREECESLVREIEQARTLRAAGKPHIVAA